MTATIELQNALSRVYAPPEVLRTVRHHVAYRVKVVPPPPAQAVIKGFFHKNRRRCGTERDLASLWLDYPTASKLYDAGMTPDTLTGSMMELTLKQKGTWDGWQRMIGPDGVFPTGVLRHVERALALRAGETVETRDMRGVAPAGRPLDANVPLYPFQADAVEEFLAHRRGVIDLPPRSGKTRIAIAAVVRLGLRTLYLAPGVGLAKQVGEAFREFLPADDVVVATGGRMSATRERAAHRALVLVSTPGTAINAPGVEGREFLIVDEFHHAAAATWRAVSNRCRLAYWRMGLTGTHYRADGADLEMHGVLAEAVYQRTVGDMVRLGRLVPARVAMLRVRGEVTTKDYYNDGVVSHPHRNAVLAWAAHTLVQAGKRVLVLTKQVGHSEDLAARIPGAVQVDGRSNEDVKPALDALERREATAVVGTSVIGEGRDVPAADALVYAAGGKSRVKVKQDYFRVLTEHAGKRVGIIVDAADTQHKTLVGHAADRLLLYRTEPEFAADVMESEAFESWLAANG
tara:strand:+ start:1393 stop:2943 length:1551 start_codon:yes stop_codon:yes gene_type:complete